MIKLALKDLKLFFKDKRSVLVTFAIPIALITLFAFAFGGAGKSGGSSKIKMQLSDLDSTTASYETTKIFDSLKSILVLVTPLEQALENIKKGKQSCVLIIHKGFSDSLSSGKGLPLELQYDEAKEIEVGLLQQSLISTVASLPFSIGDPKTSMANRFNNMVKDAPPGLQKDIQNSSDGLFDLLSEGFAQDSSVPQKTQKNIASDFLGGDIKMTKLIAAGDDNKVGLVQAVAGTAVMMLLFSVVGIGMGLLDEKQEGTLKRLLYTPMNPISILFGKMIAANIISIFQLLIMFLFANLVFGLDIFSHLGGLLIMILATSFACSAFGVLLASFARSRQQVQGLSTLIILVMSAIGGSMMPIFFMPAFMQKLAIMSVNYWSIQGFFDIFWRSLSFTDSTFLFRVLVLMLIGLTLNTLAVVMFKKNILNLN
ncbi:MAG: ABC transporter permease [Chitinophagales bacterium]|nr:ABC transporter permease [Chitinophagales bacterium]